MRIALALCVFAIGLAPSARGQVLDIGGIEIRLGQRPEDALRSLASYQVQYNGSAWIVSQKAGGQDEVLGTLGARDAAVVFISKSFSAGSDEDIAEVYTRASKELRRRGGNSCATREVQFADGLVHGFETQCGEYKLSYMMPWKMLQGSAAASVSLSVQTK